LYRTEQEQFWAGDFGDEYMARNAGDSLLATDLGLFSKVLSHVTEPPLSLIEFGANVGMNLRALRGLLPACELHAIEINEKAAEQLRTFLPADRVYHDSILEFKPHRTWDIALIKGVLIHINPDELPAVYDKLHAASARYIVVCEYYSPVPVEVAYRGHAGRLFKRDFAGEILDRFSDTRLVGYGFQYHRDPVHPADDVTWFVLEKTTRGSQP
jgi:pseudaminic acid biosynthesis-associated methylase